MFGLGADSERGFMNCGYFKPVRRNVKCLCGRENEKKRTNGSPGQKGLRPDYGMG